MFQKILIANRGEIACRVITTARRMGVRTVAVYSDADAHSRHVAMADEAVHIGAAPAAESYLIADRILEAAKRTGAQAVHPGYGFLSENATFSDDCAAADIKFIGPPADAIRAMGSKSEAKKIMQEAGVPLVPGYHGDDQSPELLRAEANKCGYPVLIKAAAGGGGKGMRIVETDEDFLESLASCQREAIASFGDDHVLVEKYLVKPRHIEIQVFADSHGNAVHLFERDCSVQRRHQKVVEEAPAPGMTQARRDEMGAAAIAAAKAIGYEGAGTVEFIVDQSGTFFFMEMNTRLQVEHPVTEYISNQDLVEWQLRVASGDNLPKSQDQLTISGHAVEARIYAEDPQRDFLPAIGLLQHLQFPEENVHVRIDTGVRTGDEVSIHYDPMIAKLIVWDENRTAAMRRMARALKETQIVGLANNIEFLGHVVEHPAFANGEFDTSFIDTYYDDLLSVNKTDQEQLLVLATLYVMAQRKQQATDHFDPSSPWALADNWRMNMASRETLHFNDGQAAYSATVTQDNDGYHIMVNDHQVNARAQLLADGTLRVDLDGQRMTATIVAQDDQLHVFSDLGAAHFTQVDPTADNSEEGAVAGSLTAPMPGKVVQVLVEVGSQVSAGDPLIVLEAMKMEHTISAPEDGTVSELLFAAGDLVDDSATLLVIDSE